MKNISEQFLGSLNEFLAFARSRLNDRARQQLRQRVEETGRVCAEHGCLDYHCDDAPRERN